MVYDPGLAEDMRAYLNETTPYEVIAEGIWKDQVVISFFGFIYGVDRIAYYPDGRIEIVVAEKPN